MNTFVPFLTFVLFIDMRTTQALLTNSQPNKIAKQSTQSLQQQTIVTNQRGQPLQTLEASLKVGKTHILLADTNFIEHLAHFDRERIPERVVHAKGAGAHGYFEVTHDITKYTKASIFSEIGKKTDLFVRTSTVGGELGSADTAHDPRGFAIKFYTDQGIWNLVGNNLPTFPIRDPILFPSFVHSRKRNPQTHLPDVNMFWDFTSLRPETTHHTLQLFSDYGYPLTLRHMNGAGVHTFKLQSANGDIVLCKFHWLTEQGVRNMTPATAVKLAGINPDYHTEDLFNSIAKGTYPSWGLYVQIMTLQEAEEYQWNPYDITKVWWESDFPLIPVGRIVLNRNPKNYFAEVEMAAFDPGDVVPGIVMSQDPMLVGRSFSYGDSQRYRLGTNFLQLPINRPKNFDHLVTLQRDGPNVIDNGCEAPNYWPNSFSDSTSFPNPHYQETPFEVFGTADRSDTGDDDNFSQPTIYLESLTVEERKRLVRNLANDLKKVLEKIQQRALENFEMVSSSFAQEIRDKIQKMKMKEADETVDGQQFGWYRRHPF